MGHVDLRWVSWALMGLQSGMLVSDGACLSLMKYLEVSDGSLMGLRSGMSVSDGFPIIIIFS